MKPQFSNFPSFLVQEQEKGFLWFCCIKHLRISKSTRRQQVQLQQRKRNWFCSEQRSVVGEGLVLIICWERLKKSKMYYSQLHLSVYVFVWADCITALKVERKPEDCKDVLQDLPFGKAQPGILKVARNKSCWGLCWVSIVPLAVSAPGQEVTLTVCTFTTFLLKSELFQRKGETRIKHKGIKKHSNGKRQNFTCYWILPSSHSSGAHRKCMGEPIQIQLDAFLQNLNNSFSKNHLY